MQIFTRFLALNMIVFSLYTMQSRLLLQEEKDALAARKIDDAMKKYYAKEISPDLAIALLQKAIEETGTTAPQVDAYWNIGTISLRFEQDAQGNVKIADPGLALTAFNEAIKTLKRLIETRGHKLESLNNMLDFYKSSIASISKSTSAYTAPTCK